MPLFCYKHSSLSFKFSGAAESVYIFDKVGLGAVGRMGTGVAEMITAILLLIPALAWLGAIQGISLTSFTSLLV